MGKVSLFNGDNSIFLNELVSGGNSVDVVYADCIYESEDFSWANYCYELLKSDGIFFVQTDYHTVAEWKIYLDKLFGKDNFINWLIYVQEWGGTSNRTFPRKHDDILMYAKGKNYKFYPERVQVKKVTAGTKLDKKGTGMKTPCDVFYDLGNFSTVSRERIKTISGENIRWQKPLKLFDRILGVCTDSGDLLLDPFMGSGSSGEYAVRHGLDYVGIESEKEVFEVALNRLKRVSSELGLNYEFDVK